MQNIYSNCIYFLSKLDVSSTSFSEDYNEAQKWLQSLLIYHPDRNSEDYYELYNYVLHFILEKPNRNDISELRALIIELASADKRVHGDGELRQYSAIYWENKGRKLLKNMPEEALTYFDKAILINQKYAPIRVNRGRALAQLTRYNDAFEELEKSKK